MSINHSELIQRLMAFDIDGLPRPAFTFADRLAKDNGWSKSHAVRVIREYKRFLVLAATEGHAVTPSHAVDEAWHLHLTYTRSYWDRLCGEVLGRPLHHEPTAGGASEEAKFASQYLRTLLAYKRTFGESPPLEIWPVRAAAKRSPAKFAMLAAAVLIGVAGCVVDDNPLNLPRTEYLLGFFIPLLISAFVVGLGLRWLIRGPGGQAESLDWDQAAYLGGGTQRLFTAAIARMVAKGRIAVSANGKTLERKSSDNLNTLMPVERAVWDALPIDNSNRWTLKTTTRKVEEAFADRKRGLCDEGLALEGWGSRIRGLLSAVPLMLVITLYGLPRLFEGWRTNTPSDYLLMTLIVSGIVWLCMLPGPKRTRRGDATLAQVRSQRTSLRTETSTDDIGLAVALYGTAVLIDPSYQPLQSWYPHPGTGSSTGCGTGCGSSSGGDSGGSGCGGGGCGGGGCGGGGGD